MATLIMRWPGRLPGGVRKTAERAPQIGVRRYALRAARAHVAEATPYPTPWPRPHRLYPESTDATRIPKGRGGHTRGMTNRNSDYHSHGVPLETYDLTRK